LIQGWELTVRSPRLWNRGQVYVTYSNQLALAFGNINGGLTDFSFGDGYGLLDHDQRNTLHFGGNVNLPWNSSASTDVYYGSGFTNGDAPETGPFTCRGIRRLTFRAEELWRAVFDWSSWNQCGKPASLAGQQFHFGG